MSSTREVVITGLGVICPLGVGRDALWNNLLAGASGVARSPVLGDGATPFRLAGQVTGFDPKEHIQPRKTIKVMCREIQFAFAAAGMAMADAGLAKGQVQPERLGVVMGSELLYGEVEELFATFRQCQEADGFHVERYPDTAMKEIFPLWMLKYLPNMPACHIGIAFDGRGPNNSIVQGPISSLNAFYEAACCIQRGHSDVMLTGGAGSLISFTSLCYRGGKRLSSSADPLAAPLPFDARRDGAVLGEGCGVLVLENRDHAERRGANILARLAGFANRFEAANATRQPTGQALRAAISAALGQAGVTAGDLACVSSAASGERGYDTCEAQAIHATAGDAPVLAAKAGMGDLGAGSGAVELIAGLLALRQGQVPPTRGYEQADPACPVNVVRGEPLPHSGRALLKTHHNPSGQASALVLVRD